tara:strand:- start:8051 stop:9127 length:1077 start_codon:yes stop_codon:yes gene_type:complete
MNRNEWIQQAHRLEASGQAFALVSVLRAQVPTSAKAGDKAVVTADGKIHGWIGGGCAQPAVIKTVRLALQDGQPRTIRITPSDESQERSLGDVLEFGMSCHSGGTLELFVDPVLQAPELVVIGDSPVARSLVSLAPRLGLRVVVIANGAQAHDFPDASVVLSQDDSSSVRAQVAAGSLVVVATQGRRDMQGLQAALALQPKQLWFIASARKASVLCEQLLASGQAADQVGQIISPAGESIGAQTPEEIALSVLASVVACRRMSAPLLAATPVSSMSELPTQGHQSTQATVTTGQTGGCCASSKTTAEAAMTTSDVEALDLATDVASSTAPLAATYPALDTSRSTSGGGSGGQSSCCGS